jgi:hypothetical protein
LYIILYYILGMEFGSIGRVIDDEGPVAGADDPIGADDAAVPPFVADPGLVVLVAPAVAIERGLWG